MDPSTLNYVYLYGLVIAVVIAYLLWRPKRRVSRLKLRETGNQNKLEVINPIDSTFDPKNAPENSRRQERELNIIFQYNGHEFDVYEVFGLPPGSGFETIDRAYQKTLAETDGQSKIFFDTAFRAARMRYHK